MRSLVARAPVRIDFGGGWTDVPPYSDERGGCVCNLAIARYAVASLRTRQNRDTAGAHVAGGDTQLAEAAIRRAALTDVFVELHSDFPVGAGLGGSSAAGVAVNGALMAWCGAALDRAALAEASRRIEVEDLGVAGGRQDHYAAAFGGALGLWFGGGTVVRRLPLGATARADLERRCLVAYTGQSRISGDTITAVLDAYRAGERRVLGALQRMKDLAEQMVVAFEREDLDQLGSLVREHWVHQRSLHPAIPTPRIDALLERAYRAGAIGGKALGASGGGCVLVIAPDEGVEAVRQAVASLGELLPVIVDDGGFQVTATTGDVPPAVAAGRA
jgi:D-glycero-alpha-D-manno-heptose-7-phosphate kinase